MAISSYSSARSIVPTTVSSGASTGNGQFSISLPYASDMDRIIKLLYGYLPKDDGELSNQADQVYEAQRKVADAEINSQVNKALAQNGLLPTGGLASRYYADASKPIYDRINAQRAQTFLDLQNNRNTGLNSMLGTLSQAQDAYGRLELSKQQQEQQLAFDREKAAQQQRQFDADLAQRQRLSEAELAAQNARLAAQNAMSQAELDYRKLSDSQKLAFERERIAAENARYFSGLDAGGGGTRGASSGGAVRGGGGISDPYSLNYGEGMRENYNQMVANERLRSGRDANGNYVPGSQTYTMGPVTMREVTDRAQQQQQQMYQAQRERGNIPAGQQVPQLQYPGQTNGLQVYAPRNMTGNGTLSGGSGFMTFDPAPSFYNPTASGSSFTPTLTSFNNTRTGSGFSGPTSMFPGFA